MEYGGLPAEKAPTIKLAKVLNIKSQIMH